MTIGVKVEDGVVINRVVGVPEGYIETDGTPQIGWIYDAVSGEFSAPAALPPTWDEIRTIRAGLLAACDWTQLADASLTTEEKAAWADYRQALRDIPQDFDTPAQVVWPDLPA